MSTVAATLSATSSANIPHEAVRARQVPRGGQGRNQAAQLDESAQAPWTRIMVGCMRHSLVALIIGRCYSLLAYRLRLAKFLDYQHGAREGVGCFLGENVTGVGYLVVGTWTAEVMR